MGQHKGSDVILSIGDGEDPEVYTVVGGLQQVNLSIDNRMLDDSTVLDGQWQSLKAGCGMRNVKVNGQGSFTSSAGENLITAAAFTTSEHNYSLAMPDGSIMAGGFLVEQYERKGAITEEERFSVVLRSMGEVIYTPA